LPARVQKGITDYVEQCTTGDQEEVLPPAFFQETRAAAAKLIGAKTEEVALVGPTSLALSFIAEGIRFKKKGNVLIYQDDYPSNVYPWMTLVHRGMEVRFLNIKNYGILRTRDIIGQVDENTRMVAVASCHFISGCRLDLDEVGKFLRSRGILFCVDGIQTLGAFETSIRNVDFLAADAHKWLLGPCGAGIMYVRKELQEMVRPVAHGWHNIRCPDYVAQDDLEYKPDARKYEAGSHGLVGLAGLKASMEMLLEVGIDAIAKELLRKRQYLVAGLTEKGYIVLNAGAEPQFCGGMISFFKPETDLRLVHERLAAEKIVVSLRADRRGQKYVRVSPHFYNTDAELGRLMELL
jgi:selenocysteine lyase/cysteine desulfurase